MRNIIAGLTVLFYCTILDAQQPAPVPASQAQVNAGTAGAPFYVTPLTLAGFDLSAPTNGLSSNQVVVVVTNTFGMLVTNPVTVGGVTYWLDGTGSHGSNTANAAVGGFDTNRNLVGNPVTQMGTIATAAAQANNLVTPTGGTLTNVGSVLVTNGSIAILYGQTIGQHTYTLLDASGAITTGGSIGINSAFVGYQQIPMYSSAMLNIQQDTFGGIQMFNNSSIYPIFAVAESYVVGGNTTTNGDWPLGATWMDLDSQGGVLYRRSFTAAELGIVATGNNDFTTLETAFETSVNPDVWGPTNVYQWQALTNGTVVYGPLLSAVPIRSSGTPIRWTGTVQPALTTATNATWLGNGGVMVSNIPYGSTNILLMSVNLGSIFLPYTYNSAGVWTNNIDVTKWVSNTPPIAIWRNAAGAGQQYTNLSANLLSYSITWTNNAGWKQGSNISEPFVSSPQYTYVFSNAAPYITITPSPALVLNTPWTNTWGGDVEMTINYVLVDSAVSGVPALVITNLTTLESFSLGNNYVIAGASTNLTKLLLSPNDVIIVTNLSSGSASAAIPYVSIKAVR